MKVYDSFGTFVAKDRLNLAIMTTNIGYDIFKSTHYYDISSPDCYAVAVVISTEKRNANDLSLKNPDSAFIEEISINSFSTKFLDAADLKLTTIAKDKLLLVKVLHAVGFDLTNQDDENEIKKLKDAIPQVFIRACELEGNNNPSYKNYLLALDQIIIAPPGIAGSPPAQSGNGILIGR